MNTKKDTQKGQVLVVKPTPNGEAKNLTVAEKKEAAETIKKLLPIESTPEKRLSGLKVLNKLSEKVEYLRRTNEDFNLFVASLDGTSCKMTLENSQGFKFTATNSGTLEKVVDIIGKDLDKVTKEAEKEFLDFSI